VADSAATSPQQSTLTGTGTSLTVTPTAPTGLTIGI
jgi:hypothetical protein